MAETVANCIERTYDILYAGGQNRPQRTQLNGAILAAATTGTVDDSGVVPDNSIIEIERERILTGDNSTTSVAFTTRGYLASDAADHGDNAEVLIKPTFYRDEIFAAVKDVVTDLYPTLYLRAVKTDATYATSTPIDLDSGVKGVLSVRVLDNGVYRRIEPEHWEFQNESGSPELQFFGSPWTNGSALRIVQKKAFTAPTAESDDLNTTCGVPTTLERRLPLAVAAYVLEGREVPRIQLQKVTSAIVAQGVPIGAAEGVSEALLRRFRMYVNNEVLRLHDDDPPRRTYQR